MVTDIPFSFATLTVIEELYANLRFEFIQETLSLVRESILQNIGVKCDVSDFNRTISRCTKCIDLNHPPVLPIGASKNPDLMIVVASPTGIKSNLAALLNQVGFSTDNVRLSYATRCAAAPGPEAIELSNCQGHLISEIEIVKPRLIVTMGSAASTSLLGPLKLTLEHGKIYWAGLFPIMPIYSMAYAARLGCEDILLADLRRAYNFCYTT